MDKRNYSDGESPIMFVKKKDGKLRLCVDNRALNHVTKKERYPLPLIGEALDRLQTAKYYTKLDIKDAYHNVRIKEGDEWKTTFTTKYGTYEYLVMPFGLTNAPAAFQRWINRTLQSYIDICCIVYLDDVLIYSENLEQHQKDLAAIIRAIRQQGMKLKPSKCEFHQQETEYLGFIINNEGVKVDPIKNCSHMGLESTYQQKWNSGIHGVLQLLSTLYKWIQQNSQTTIRSNQERCRLGMGKQKTNRL